MMQCGSERPPWYSSSTTLSRAAESLEPGRISGSSLRMSSPKRSEANSASRDRSQFRLPRRVLISPLWAKAERVGQIPGRKGVGAVTLVDHGHGTGQIRLAEIREVVHQLMSHEHAFVDKGAAGEARDVKKDLLFQAVPQDGVFRAPADDEKLAFELVLVRDVRIAGDENLLDDRFDVSRERPQDFLPCGHAPPAEELLPLLADDVRQFLAAKCLLRRIGRQKDQAAGIASGFGQLDLLIGADPAQKAVRQLDHDAGPVAGIGIAGQGPAVDQVEQYLQPLGDDLVRRPALQMTDESDAAGIVLVTGIIQALCSGRPRRRGPLCIHIAPSGLLHPIIIAITLSGAVAANSSSGKSLRAHLVNPARRQAPYASSSRSSGRSALV